MISDHLKASSYAAPHVTPSRHAPGARERLLNLLRAKLAVSPSAAAVVETEVPEQAVTGQEWPSVDIVYDEMQQSMTAQNDRLKTIDTKANFGLAAATLLTAGVTGLGRALMESGQEGATPVWFGIQANYIVDWVTIISLVVYAAIAYTTYRAYRIQTFKEVPSPQRLLDKYLYEEPEATKAAIANARLKAYTTNEGIAENKVTWVNRAMWLLIVEALLLVIIAVIQVAWL